MGLYLTDGELEKVVTKTVKTTLNELQGEFSRDNQIRNLKNRNNQLEKNNESLKNKIKNLREGRKSTKTPVSKSTRHDVFMRDDYRCCECGATNQQTRLTIDHIIPRALGGTNDIDNLQTLCEECNTQKGTSIWKGGDRGVPAKAKMRSIGVREE